MSKLAINGGTPVTTKPAPGWPVWDNREIEALKQVVETGKWGIGGEKNREFEKKFAQYQDAKYGVTVVNGTAALEVAMKAGGIKGGDEVITTPYTFISTANAILFVGAVPKFVDIDPDNFNIDPGKIEKAVTRKTKAIIPVHMCGCPADMEKINAIAKKHNLIVIEDAAQAHGAAIKGKKVGAIGHMGTFSFQSSKNITSGEGGMVLTNDPDLYEKCCAYRNVGRLFKSQWYEHELPGWNYRLSEFQAAVLLVQLDRAGEQADLRNENGNYLYKKLSEIEGIVPQKKVNESDRVSWHLFAFRYDAGKFKGLKREKFLNALESEGIPCLAGYTPVHKYEIYRKAAQYFPANFRANGRKADYGRVKCGTCERLCADNFVWFNQPLLLGTKADMDNVVNAIIKIKENASEIK